ncbi:LytR family transcriptional regulator, partial [Streptomyces albidoflavus]|nr:LytR family transcriptional regulator [Streptomyces albidoflavus]
MRAARPRRPRRRPPRTTVPPQPQYGRPGGRDGYDDGYNTGQVYGGGGGGGVVA